MTLAMSASDIARNPFKMTRYAATHVKYNPESQKAMHAKKFFKITPTQEDIYNLLSSTEAERPMSSTLSPYAPLPAIGNTFVGPAKNNRRTRVEERKHQVVMETVDLKRAKAKTVTRLEPKKKQHTVKKEKSLEVGSNHGRHILNMIGLKGKKKEKDRETKKLDDVGSRDATEVFGASNGDNNTPGSEVDTESKVSTENTDDVVHISSDLSALNCSSASFQTTRNHESEEFIHNCIKDIEKKSASIKTPLTPKKKHFTLVRERTYDLLEPKILKSKQDECELGTEQSCSRMSGKARDMSHELSLEPFGPISLEQSTGSIAFGRRLSSMGADIDDFERSTASGGLSDENTDDFVYNMNDNTGLDVETRQLGNTNQREPQAATSRSGSPVVGMVPRVLELKRSHLDGLPSASRFAKAAEGDLDTVFRNKMINRLNSPLRLTSGKISDNAVRVLDITPLHLEGASVAGLRRPSGKGKIKARDVKTPYIDKVNSFDGSVKTESGSDRIKVGGLDSESQSMDEIDSSLCNMRLESPLKRSQSRFMNMKTPSIDEIGSYYSDVNTQIGADNNINSNVWESTNPPNVKSRSSRQSASDSRFINTRTPSIEEIGSVDSGFLLQRGRTRGFTPVRKGRGSAFSGGRTSAFKTKPWNLRTPSVEEIGSVDDKVEVSSPRVEVRDTGAWSPRTPSIDEIETRDVQGSSSIDDLSGQEDPSNLKAYWIDL